MMRKNDDDGWAAAFAEFINHGSMLGQHNHILTVKDDNEFGSFWKLIYKEYTLAKKVLLDISGFESLMQNEPAGKASIKAREEIVQPLLTIQQFALMQLQNLKNQKTIKKEKIEVFEAMVTRSLFGNINASRNSA